MTIFLCILNFPLHFLHIVNFLYFDANFDKCPCQSASAKYAAEAPPVSGFFLLLHFNLHAIIASRLRVLALFLFTEFTVK